MVDVVRNGGDVPGRCPVCASAVKVYLRGSVLKMRGHPKPRRMSWDEGSCPGTRAKGTGAEALRLHLQDLDRPSNGPAAHLERLKGEADRAKARYEEALARHAADVAKADQDRAAIRGLLGLDPVKTIPGTRVDSVPSAL